MQITVRANVPPLSPLRDKAGRTIENAQLRLIVDGEHVFIPLSEVTFSDDAKTVDIRMDALRPVTIH